MNRFKQMKERLNHRLNHIGSVLVFAPFIFIIEWGIYVMNGSKSKPTDHFKFLWNTMWEPLDEDQT